MEKHERIEKGRGITSLFLCLFLLLLSLCFIISGSTVFLLLGIFSFGLFLSCLYAFIVDESWSFKIEENILSWSYPRWPKSSGEIDLYKVSHITIDDAGNTLKIIFINKEETKIRFIGFGEDIRNYLNKNHPQIGLEYYEGSS